MFRNLHLRRTTDIKEGGEETDTVVEVGVDMIEVEDGKVSNETFVTRNTMHNNMPIIDL